VGGKDETCSKVKISWGGGIATKQIRSNMKRTSVRELGPGDKGETS
jgi:hypothetical protein